MKILVIGYYGSNFGDLLMLKVVLSHLQLGKNNITIFTYGDEDMLHRALAEEISSGALKIFGLSRSGALKNFVQEVKPCKAVIWGGGTCFMDEGGTGGVKYMLIAWAMRKPVFYLGVGVDSHNGFRTKLSLFAAAMISRAIYPRDNESKHIFEKWSISRSVKLNTIPDLAFAYFDKFIPNTHPVNDAPYIVLCLRDLKSYESEDTNKVLSQQLTDLVLRILRDINVSTVLILIGDQEIDLPVSELCRDLLEQEGYLTEIIHGWEITRALETISRANFLLTVRLHPAVVAQAMGVPYALFNYSDKNKKFTNALGEQRRLLEKEKIYTFQPDYRGPSKGCSKEYSDQIKLAFSNIFQEMMKSNCIS